MGGSSGIGFLRFLRLLRLADERGTDTILQTMKRDDYNWSSLSLCAPCGIIRIMASRNAPMRSSKDPLTRSANRQGGRPQDQVSPAPEPTTEKRPRCSRRIFFAYCFHVFRLLPFKQISSRFQADFKHISSTFPSRLDAQPSTFQADSRCNANRLKAPMSGALILPYEISTAPGFVRQIGDFRPSRVNTLRLFPNP